MKNLYADKVYSHSVMHCWCEAFIVVFPFCIKCAYMYNIFVTAFFSIPSFFQFSSLSLFRSHVVYLGFGSFLCYIFQFLSVVAVAVAVAVDLISSAHTSKFKVSLSLSQCMFACAHWTNLANSSCSFCSWMFWTLFLLCYGTSFIHPHQFQIETLECIVVILLQQQRPTDRPTDCLSFNAIESRSQNEKCVELVTHRNRSSKSYVYGMLCVRSSETKPDLSHSIEHIVKDHISYLDWMLNGVSIVW